MPLGERLGREEFIAAACRSGKYNTEELPNSRINKCNLFLDDILQSQWDIKLPRHSEDPLWSKIYPGWENRPMKAPALEYYLKKASELPESGVRKVSPQKAASLASQGEPVAALGVGHATLYAPNTDWPTVYRSNLAFRGEDKRIKVGLRIPSDMSAFHIDSKQYKKYRESAKRKEVAKP